MDEWIKDLTLDMIPEPYKQVANVIGLENFIRLAKTIGGTTIYIPKSDSFLRPIRDINIKKEFNGYNHKELARKYNLSERWIVEICGEGDIEGQMSLFNALGSNS